MPEYLVGIAEGSKITAGELEVETRMALADAGFREAAQLDYSDAAVWMAGEHEPEPESESFRRIVYRYEAEDEAQAEADARAIVGPDFNIRVTQGPGA